MQAPGPPTRVASPRWMLDEPPGEMIAERFALRSAEAVEAAAIVTLRTLDERADRPGWRDATEQLSTPEAALDGGHPDP